MWFMGFSNVNCKDCYACARVCPVHAIKVKDKEAHIMTERCIICGKCMKVCPQYARVKSSIGLVKKYLMNHEIVVASVDQSFYAAFGEHSNVLTTALRKLGFNYVEETICGIDNIGEIYEKYANDPSEIPYITSFCPSVISLVQKHYPHLIKNLIPSISTTTAHARILKQKYGENVKVVAIGPCLSRKVEGYSEKSIDVVITFVELVEWLQNEKIDLDKLEKSNFDNSFSYEKVNTITGDAIDLIINKDKKRNIIKVDGIKDCISVLEGIKKGRFKNSILAMYCCRHGCLQGVGMVKDNLTAYEIEEKFYKYFNMYKEDGIKNEIKNDLTEIQLKKNFEPLNVPLKQPGDKELKKILNDMGRYKKQDEVNCASCGYHTCREKAVAVYNGMAEVDMCLPFMREKAETLTNIIFDTVPEIIVIIDKEFNITQLNIRAKKFFRINDKVVNGTPVDEYLDRDTLRKVKETKGNIIKQKVFIAKYDATIIQSIIWVELNQVILFFADDITEYENMEKKHQQVKYDSINMAQQVINKQMVVAQQIASLLGETTAETKVTLTKLKNLIQEEEDRK
ncbi:[Fe-Fe] hydrogenase large subunit C-terminal domain-containing protein [Romboutsia sp.]|uniref:[Fe-Fe] hydrogenase large subunit C-terminal domain-containing protein n=1 Tax=Romboutsia sp. TaxID=1965302 RepID=UPI003F34058A